MKVKIKKLHPDAKIPTYGSDGAACFDLYAAEVESLHSGHMIKCSTGLAFEIPSGYEMQIRPRSGMMKNNGVMAFDGTIDADYRGCVDVLLYTVCFAQDQMPRVGDKIAQAKIAPVEQAVFEEVEELSDTERGASGFGSSGR